MKGVPEKNTLNNDLAFIWIAKEGV